MAAERTTGGSHGGGRGRLAWSLWAVALVTVLTGVGLSVAAGAPHDERGFDLLPVVTATVGALIAARVPGNPIGWLLLGTGVLGGVASLAGGYADLALLAGSGSARLGVVSAWVAMWLFWPFVMVPLLFVLLLFPDGRLPSPRWRVLPWLAAVAIAATAAHIAFHPEVGENRWFIENPFALAEGSWLVVAFDAGVSLNLPALAGAVAAVVVRFRRSSGAERQQLKWIAYGGVVAAGLFPIVAGVFDETMVAKIGVPTVLAIIPTCIGVAILRYRLYEIDRLISRTVAYALVVAVLVAVYVGGVILLRSVFPLQGGLAVAASTLAVAALFNPLRRRVQHRVDRRFNRARYDAEQVVERFAARLRNELDLDELTDDLLAVVRSTMQPATASVWIRAGDRL